MVAPAISSIVVTKNRKRDTFQAVSAMKLNTAVLLWDIDIFFPAVYDQTFWACRKILLLP